ncbi:MAG TPA: HAD family phosphatase [Blastocatellia bacterium]|nr:HAD family phosphatase [Blastocatellia bacterium]
MLRAIIFDCDGVIADTEPLHLTALQAVLREEGIDLDRELYYRDYLALDDRSCFIKAFSDHAVAITEEKLSEVSSRKAATVERIMRDHLRLFPGAADLIHSASQRFVLAVASGALRREVEFILEVAGVTASFKAIVGAEDVARSKPHPDPFLEALARINAGSPTVIRPDECLVIEDSIHGINAAHAAGMRCLAVTNSYPREMLAQADLVVKTFEDLPIDQLELLFENRPGRGQ